MPYCVYERLLTLGMFTYNSCSRTYYYTNFNTLKENGINKIIIQKKTFKNNLTGCSIRMVLNPSKMLYNDVDPLTTLNPNDYDYEKMYKIFHETIMQLMSNVNSIAPVDEELNEDLYWLSDFNHYRITRIDYCVNLFLDDEAEVRQYLRLLSKGDIPHKYGAKFRRNKVGCYYVNKRVNINFYNKLAQMTAHNEKARSDDKKYTQSELDLAKNILRLEVQCKAAMLGSSTFKRKYGHDRTEYFSIIIARDIIHKYLTEVSQNGDYYKYIKAEGKIEQKLPKNYNSSRRKTKSRYEKMLDLFRKINMPNCKGLWSYRSKLSKDESKKMNEILKLFDEVGINAITLPIKYPKESLPNLWKIASELYFDSVEEEVGEGQN